MREARLEFAPRCRAAGRCRRPAGSCARVSSRMRRRCSEIAAQLADILEQRAVVSAPRRPRIRAPRSSRGSPPSRRRPARADRHHAADAVIHRQAVVHAVARRACPSCRRTSRLASISAVVVDVRGLGQAGRAGGVDVQGAVLDGQRPAFARRERRRRRRPRSRDRCAELAGSPRAVDPDLRPRS